VVAAEHDFDLTDDGVVERLRTIPRCANARSSVWKRRRPVMDELGTGGAPQLMAVIDDTPIDLNGEIPCHGHERLLGVIEDLTAPA